MRRRLLLFLLLLTVAVLASGQEQDSQDADGPSSQPGGDTELPLFEATILSDLGTAGTAELLDWARSLGLSTRGDRIAVENRILGHYGLDRRSLESALQAQSDADAAAGDAKDSTGDSPPGGEEIDGGSSAPDGVSILRIGNARGSEFFTLEETDEEYLRLSGGVELSLDDGETVHRIEAQEIVLNLTENTLSALGSVRYTTERADATEEFRGDTIVFQIDTWEGVFIHGITETRDDTDSKEVEFSVSGERITRSAEEIIVIDGGTITSSRADPPNYRIRARRIWVLAPGEWGLRNAVLYVGRVPTFYLPVFFLPGDRLFFHPAIGTRTRDGAFIQTTTYFIGESEERDPPISIMRLAESPTESDRVIQGLFLRIPDETVPPDPPGWNLKLMVDAYTALGSYAGVAGAMPDLAIFDTFDWRIGLAASRSIFRRDGEYSPWYIDDSGRARQNWNTGWFLGTETPFRYESEFSSSLRLGTLSLSLDMLLLSDPEFRRDFGARSEAMDWGFIINSGGEEEPDTGASVSSATWEANLGWSPDVPDILNPWISSFSISGLRSRLDLNTRASEDLPDPLARNDIDTPPEARFFYPDTLVLPDLAVQLRGSLLELPAPVADRRREEPSGEMDPGDDGTPLRPPWENTEPPDPSTEERFRLPPPAPDAPGIPDTGAGRLRLQYSLQPNLRYDRITDNDEWNSGADVGLDWAYSTLQTRTRGQLTASAQDAGSYVALSSSLSAEHRYQDVDVESDVDETRRDALELAAFRYRAFSATQNSSVTGYPLRDVPRLDRSTLRYTLNSLVFSRAFQELGADDVPQYEERWGDWTEEDVSSHQTQAQVVWDLWNAEQRFTATSDLPPRNRSYLGSATVRTGPLTTSLSGGWREDDEEEWNPENLIQNHTLTLADDDLQVSQRLEYDMDRLNLLQARTSLSAWIFDAALTGRETVGYRFVPGAGWEQEGEPTFRWTTLTSGVAVDQTVQTWKRRIDLALIGDLAINMDLQRYTNSNLLLNYGFSVDVYRFLELDVTARTRNDLIYQYVPSLADETGRPRRRFGADLLDSLRIFDRPTREESFFKLESLSISALHDLQDWELSFTYTGRPILDEQRQPADYRWDSLVSIVLRWRPISELRRTVEIKEGDVTFSN
jgi:hypothetical protein